MTDKIILLSTCETGGEAERLARHLVESRLAACVNIIPQAGSVYRWKGEVQHSQESLLVIKTSRALFDEVRAALETAHSYELPEVLAIPVVAGSPNYLAWLSGELKGGESD